jgi:hypothetical protein
VTSCGEAEIEMLQSQEHVSINKPDIPSYHLRAFEMISNMQIGSQKDTVSFGEGSL